jgi:hypothetical protein
MNKILATLLVLFFVSLALSACGGSSGGNGGGLGGGGGAGGGGGTPPEIVMVPLGTAVKNVTIQPNTATQFSFTYTIPTALLSQPITAYKDFAVNLADTMPHVQVTSAPVADNAEPSLFDPYQLLQRLARLDLPGSLLGIKSAFAATQATVTVYVSYAGDPDACANGTVLGSYNFDGDFDTQPTSDTAVATTEGMGAGLHVVSTGSFEMCLDISPLPIPMPAYVTVDEIAVEAATCDLDPLPDGDVLGDWSGTYSCDNVGAPDEVDLPISLTIIKNTDGSFRYVDDGAATYDGYFCGPEFRHVGGLPGDYTESGKLTITGAGTATKESVWNSIPAGFSGGTCSDSLTKD